MSILLGLLAALCWGGTDFLAGRSAQKIGVTLSLFYTQLLGFLVLTIWLGFDAGGRFPNAPTLIYLICIVAAVCNLCGLAALLKALTLGKAAIVAPIMSLYGMVTTLLSLLSGKQLGLLLLLGLGLCVLGACLLCMSPKQQPQRQSGQALAYAFLSALGFGLGFWLQGEHSIRHLGITTALWLYYLSALVLLLLALCQQGHFKRPPKSLYPLLVAVSVLSLTGFVAMAYGAYSGHLAVVTVLSSLAGGVTALLGIVVLKERLSRHQCAGMVIILFSVALLKVVTFP